jgi:hypothetical protein
MPTLTTRSPEMNAPKTRRLGAGVTETLTPRTSRLLDIQGFDTVEVQEIARVAPWLRLAFGLCTLLGGLGTVLASPTILLMLTPIAAFAAASPVHPFDLIYNYGIRHLTGTGPLPRRGMPSRFGCGMGAVFLLVTAWAFSAGHVVAGYALGGMLTFVALLVSTTDICIPSMIYRSIFGWPPARDAHRKDDRHGERPVYLEPRVLRHRA